MPSAAKEVGAGDKKVLPNPLLFWKANELRFPFVAELARRTLCIPATSAPSERVFSTAGHTITKLWASLAPANAAALILLHDSWSVAEKYEVERGHKKSRTEF